MGSKLLKVISILMIVFAGIGIVMEIILFSGLAVLASVIGSNMGMYTFAVIIGLVGCVVELISGILGVKNWNVPEKAQTCVICGIVCVAFQILSNILVLVSYSQGFNVFSLLIGLVVPVLYLVGAFQLKNQNS